MDGGCIVMMPMKSVALDMSPDSKSPAPNCHNFSLLSSWARKFRPLTLPMIDAPRNCIGFLCITSVAAPRTSSQFAPQTEPLELLILEDAAKISEAREFVSVVAGMLALRMRDGADVSAGAPTEVVRTVPVLAGERSSASDLVLKGLDEATLGADVFAATAIMVVKFSDMAALAARDIDGVTTLADRVAIVLQDIAAEHNIPYMKLVGDDVVAAAGFVPDDADAILRIADAAVAVRERCLELFEAAGRKAFFHIGIDCGVVIGSHVGRQPRVFNLWGGAVRTADMMAATGPGPATIQVTEAAYNRLRQHFLFRLRGNFYLPDTGSEQAFVLGGRQ